MVLTFSEYVQQQTLHINGQLTAFLPKAVPGAERLNQAMAYSLLQGGKRVRPLLAYASAETLGGPTAATAAAACALEAIHAYSLIHDDLPAMDNDDLRRGQPTCHRAFDEATAILAGDALQTLAFETLLQAADVTPSLTLELLRELAGAAGASGMVAGQAIDLYAVNQSIGLDVLETMHSHKTGALIEAAVVMGALSTGQANPTQIMALRNYARAIGLAFQVQDDILDVVGDTVTLGKQQGADVQLNKPTYVTLLGLAEAQALAKSLYAQAITALEGFDDKALRLRELAAYIVERKY